MALKYFLKNVQRENGPGPVLGQAGFSPRIPDRKLTLWIGSETFSDKRESIVATRWRWDGHYSRFSTKRSWFITDIKCYFCSHLWMWSFDQIPFCWVKLYNEFSFMLWIWHKLNWQGLIMFLKIPGQKWTTLGQSERFMVVQLNGPNYWKWTVIC